MIKTFTVAAAFAGSMLVGVPVANASTASCMMQLDTDLAACGENSRCQMHAEAVFLQCLAKNYDTITPED